MAKRRILDAKITLISLCPRGKNKVKGLFKSQDGEDIETFVQAVSKMNSEGLLTTLVYIPNHEDADGDVAGPEVVRKLCYNAINDLEGFDVRHNMKPVGPDKVQWCENFLVQKGDPRFDGMTDEDGREIDPEGGWGITAMIHDPVLRKEYETGRWCGVSMYGSAVVEPLTKSFADSLAEGLGAADEGEQMKPEEIAALMKEQSTSIVAGIVTAMKEIFKPEEKPADPAPAPTAVKKETIAFEGDPDSLEDLAAHERKLYKASLDFSNPADIKKWRDYLAKEAESKDDGKDGKEEGKPGESDELTKARKDAELAKARVAELEKASKQPTDDVKPGSKDTVTKAAEAAARGKRMAAALIKEQSGNGGSFSVVPKK